MGEWRLSLKIRVRTSTEAAENSSRATQTGETQSRFYNYPRSVNSYSRSRVAFYPLSFDRGNDFARIGWEERILQLSLGEEATMTVSRLVFCPLDPLSRLLLF